jgi:hypothetical protein
MDVRGISGAVRHIAKITLVGSAFAFLGASAACGSSKGNDTSEGSTLQPEPTVDVGSIPCGLHTQFGDTDGDAQCLKPPPADQGFQFHYGPTNYDDPAEVAKYTLMPGQEVTDCVFMPTPNDKDVYFNTYHARMRPGSHHMLLYLQGEQVATSGSSGPTDCNQAADSRNLFGAQTPDLDIVGNADGAPENNGYAVKIPAHQQGVMQLHFINAGTKPILREAWANLLYTDASQVTQLADPIFFIAGALMDVKMGTQTVIHGTAPVPSNAGPEFRLLTATPHYHTHTTRFTMYATIDGVQTKVLEEFNPLHHLPEPGLYYYDSVKHNNPSNPAAQTDGASSGILAMKPGDHLDWECAITNDDVPQGITFANAVKTAEMCNVFGIYGPTTGTAWSAPNP